MDVYGQKYVPSQESLGPPPMGISESSTPTFVDGVREPYPAWSTERQIPLSKEEIEDIFLDLTQKFGFQRDSMRNMVSPLPLTRQVRPSLECFGFSTPHGYYFPPHPPCCTPCFIFHPIPYHPALFGRVPLGAHVCARVDSGETLCIPHDTAMPLSVGGSSGRRRHPTDRGPFPVGIVRSGDCCPMVSGLGSC